MPAGFKAGSGESIDAGIPKCRRLLGSCGRSNREDLFRPALLQNISWWNPEDEAEHRNLRVQQDARLIFKPDWRIRFVDWTRRSAFGEMAGEGREAPVECAFIRC